MAAAEYRVSYWGNETILELETVAVHYKRTKN